MLRFVLCFMLKCTARDLRATLVFHIHCVQFIILSKLPSSFFVSAEYIIGVNWTVLI